MKNNFRYLSYFLGIICSIAFLSCLDEDYFLEQFEKKYNKQWEKLFGKMDPEHDWNIIQQVNATVQVSEAGEHTLRIYTDHPKNKRSRLIAQIPVEGTGTIRFDLEKISKDVYARVKDAQGKVTFEGYFAVNGGEVLIEEGSRLLGRAVTNEQVPDGLKWSQKQTINIPTAYKDGINEYNEVTKAYNNQEHYKVVSGNLYYFPSKNGHTLTNENTTRFEFQNIICQIVKSGGVFEESQDNRDKLTTHGVEYVVSESGPVEVSYVYGVTGLHNAFGYYYWNPNSNKSFDQIPKIILMNNALPQENFRLSNDDNSTWNSASLSQLQSSPGLSLLDYVNNNQLKYIFGPKYELVYYGDDYDQEGSYNFPEGTHIGFFLYTNYWKYNSGMAWDMTSPLTAGDDYLKTLVYSIPQHNVGIKEFYDYRRYQDLNEKQNNQNTGQSGNGEISAVTYKYQGNIILGFEDGVDKDMNDILLLVNADLKIMDDKGNESNIVEQDKNYTEPEPESQSWIIACEDLGNIGDYDFNDAVFKVAHVAGSNKLKVIPLASGGTYDIEVRYKGTNISQYAANKGNKDFHQLINSEAQQNNNGLWQQINDKQKGNAGDTITITDDALTSGFSLANGDYTNHGFSIYVEKNNGPSITINQPALDKKAPQMLVLPEYWIWPYEGKIITSGYPDFEKWTNQKNIKSDWYTNPTTGQGYLVSDDIKDYPSSGTTGGENTGDGKVTLTINGKVISTLTKVNDNGNFYYSFPKSHLTGTTATIKIISEGDNVQTAIGVVKENDSSSDRLNITDKQIQINIDKITDPVIIYTYYEEKPITGITITTEGTGSGDTPTVPEEPEEEEVIPDNFSIAYTANNGSSTNLTMNNEIYKDTTGYYYLSIPKSAFNASGTKVTFTISGEKLVSGSFLSKDGEEYLSNFHFDPKSETKKTELIINLTAEQYNKLPDDSVQIYFWTGLSTVSAVKISDKVTIPATIPLTVDSQQPTDLEVNQGGSGYYVKIPRSNLSTNGATVTISTTGTTSPCLFRGDQYAEGDYGFSNSNGTYTCELSADQINQITADLVKLYFWNNSISNVTGISITNKQAETGITLTVDGQVQNEKLTIVQNSYDVIRIPIDYFNNGNDGATITFTATNPVNLNGESGLGGIINANGEQTNIKNNELTVSEADLVKNNTDVDGGGHLSIFLPLNNTYGITAITIVNHNSIPVTVNENNEDALTIGQDGSYTIPLSSYGLGSNGANITFYGNATILINEQSQTINESWNYEVSSSSYSELSFTITSGTISNITITNKESGTYKNTLTIQKEGEPIGSGNKYYFFYISQITSDTNEIKITLLDSSNNPINSVGYNLKLSNSSNTTENTVHLATVQQNPYTGTHNINEYNYIALEVWTGTPEYIKIEY